MALDALVATLMPFVLDTEEPAAITIGIIEKCVTAETKIPGFVEGKKLYVVRMIDGRAVAIFAFDRFVARGIKLRYVFFMTLNTGFPATILDGEVFPFLNITEPMIAVREVPAVNAEVIWNHNQTGYKDHSDQTYCHPQWAQHVPLHRRLLRNSCGTDNVYLSTAVTIFLVVQCSRNTLTATFMNTWRAERVQYVIPVAM
jgi:hypothetical protein